LFADSFFDIHPFAINLVIAFKNGFVDGIIVVKFNKSKSARFARVLFSQPSDSVDFSKLFKILSDIVF